ncbi:MAG: hypothetical protein R3Y61_07330 [Rikenellaceae bacterium]
MGCNDTTSENTPDGAPEITNLLLVQSDSTELTIQAEIKNASKLYYKVCAGLELWYDVDLKASQSTCTFTVEYLEPHTSYDLVVYVAYDESSSSQIEESFITAPNATPTLELQSVLCEPGFYGSGGAYAIVTSITKIYYCYYPENERPENPMYDVLEISQSGSYEIRVEGDDLYQEGQVFIVEAYGVGADESIVTEVKTADFQIITWYRPTFLLDIIEITSSDITIEATLERDINHIYYSITKVDDGSVVRESIDLEEPIQEELELYTFTVDGLEPNTKYQIEAVATTSRDDTSNPVEFEFETLAE